MGKILLTLVTALILAAFVACLISYPVMLLWNECLVGAVNGVNKITWPQALGIAVLFHILIPTSSNKSKD